MGKKKGAKFLQSEMSTSTETSGNETPAKKMRTYVSSSTERNVSNRELSDKMDRLNLVVSQVHEEVSVVSGSILDLQNENAVMKQEICSLRKEKERLEENVRDLQVGLRIARSNENHVEQWGRLWNVRIRGIGDDRKDEELEDCIMKVVMFLRKQLGLTQFPREAIDIAHRLGTYRHGEDRTIIVRFHSRMDRLAVFRQRHRLQHTRYWVAEDLTRENLRLLQKVKEVAGYRNAWSRDGKMYARLTSGRVVQIDERTPLQDLFDEDKTPNPTTTGAQMTSQHLRGQQQRKRTHDQRGNRDVNPPRSSPMPRDLQSAQPSRPVQRDPLPSQRRGRENLPSRPPRAARTEVVTSTPKSGPSGSPQQNEEKTTHGGECENFVETSMNIAPTRDDNVDGDTPCIACGEETAVRAVEKVDVGNGATHKPGADPVSNELGLITSESATPMKMQRSRDACPPGKSLRAEVRTEPPSYTQSLRDGGFPGSTHGQHAGSGHCHRPPVPVQGVRMGATTGNFFPYHHQHPSLRCMPSDYSSVPASVPEMGYPVYSAMTSVPPCVPPLIPGDPVNLIHSNFSIPKPSDLCYATNQQGCNFLSENRPFNIPPNAVTSDNILRHHSTRSDNIHRADTVFGSNGVTVLSGLQSVPFEGSGNSTCGIDASRSGVESFPALSKLHEIARKAKVAVPSFCPSGVSTSTGISQMHHGMWHHPNNPAFSHDHQDIGTVRGTVPTMSLQGSRVPSENSREHTVLNGDDNLRKQPSTSSERSTHADVVNGNVWGESDGVTTSRKSTPATSRDLQSSSVSDCVPATTVLAGPQNGTASVLNDYPTPVQRSDLDAFVTQLMQSAKLKRRFADAFHKMGTYYCGENRVMLDAYVTQMRGHDVCLRSNAYKLYDFLGNNVLCDMWRTLIYDMTRRDMSDADWTSHLNIIGQRCAGALKKCAEARARSARARSQRQAGASTDVDGSMIHGKKWRAPDDVVAMFMDYCDDFGKESAPSRKSTAFEVRSNVVPEEPCLLQSSSETVPAAASLRANQAQQITGNVVAPTKGGLSFPVDECSSQRLRSRTLAPMTKNASEERDGIDAEEVDQSDEVCLPGVDVRRPLSMPVLSPVDRNPPKSPDRISVMPCIEPLPHLLRNERGSSKEDKDCGVRTLPTEVPSDDLGVDDDLPRLKSPQKRRKCSSVRSATAVIEAVLARSNANAQNGHQTRNDAMNRKSTETARLRKAAIYVQNLHQNVKKPTKRKSGGREEAENAVPPKQNGRQKDSPFSQACNPCDVSRTCNGTKNCLKPVSSTTQLASRPRQKRLQDHLGSDATTGSAAKCGPERVFSAGTVCAQFETPLISPDGQIDPDNADTSMTQGSEDGPARSCLLEPCVLSNTGGQMEDGVEELRLFSPASSDSDASNRTVPYAYGKPVGSPSSAERGYVGEDPGSSRTCSPSGSDVVQCNESDSQVWDDCYSQCIAAVLQQEDDQFRFILKGTQEWYAMDDVMKVYRHVVEALWENEYLNCKPCTADDARLLNSVSDNCSQKHVTCHEGTSMLLCKNEFEMVKHVADVLSRLTPLTTGAASESNPSQLLTENYLAILVSNFLQFSMHLRHDENLGTVRSIEMQEDVCSLLKSLLED